MRQLCHGPVDHCDAGWKKINDEVLHTIPQCYCVRPFNSQELEEIRTCECDNFLDQCLRQRGMLYSCELAKRPCSHERLKDECANLHNRKEYKTLCSGAEETGADVDLK